MYQLERHGVQAVLIDRADHDLWVRTPSGRMLTVQVKTATAPSLHGKRQTLKYFMGNVAQKSDVYALVALHAEIVLFCSPEEMRHRWPEDAFTAERMVTSIKELFA